MAGLNEEEMCYLEEQIPELAVMALRIAYWQALATGSSVLQSDEDGVIWEHFPNGSRKFVKQITPPTRVKIGTRREIP